MEEPTLTLDASSPGSTQGDKPSSPDQPKKGKPKSGNPKAKQPASEASLKSPAKIRASHSPLLAPLKSPKAVKPHNPTMFNMVLEALKTNTSVKGLSLQGIKRYITDKYPHTKETFSNARLRQALAKGTESNEIVRPKSSEEAGLKGYFLLNRALNSEKVKLKAKESKTKKSPGSKDKVKQPAKVAKKTKAALNTSGSAKTVASKPKTAKSKRASSADEPKTAKSKPAKKSEPKTAKSKLGKSASGSKTALTKTAVRKSPKTTSTPKSVASKVKATPKLGKSTTAGSRKKTAAVKKLMKPTVSN